MLARTTTVLRRTLSKNARSFGGNVEAEKPKDFRPVKSVIGRALVETGVGLRIAGGEEVFSLRRSLMPLLDSTPTLANDTFVAPSSTIIGAVELYDTSSIWYGCVLRADNNSIKVGGFSNVQDKCTINTVPTLPSGYPSIVDIGNYTSIGVGSVLVSCTIGNECVVGAGCIIGAGSVMEDGTVLDAGTVLPPNSFIPKLTRWAGNPFAFVETLDSHAPEHAREMAVQISYLAADHIEEFMPFGNEYKHLEEVVGEGEVGEKKAFD